ncbi:MAG: DUF1566 domain-containing protein [Proteobacteria bacterium]|nr:DUF1566 domain-containing protein [Desulfobulbaceae bacterium]MBU4151814.1 DUF1566 domain-containing protein [Pseudomonadota bacterium]MDP2107244.1 DUF1566 domain-containing protein [Desulfobulbaceae bacterium]
MGIFEKLGLATSAQATIDWDITPALTFTIFESWGSKERNIRTKGERYYYFYIDSWQEPAKLCLMERGIKHARVLAEIDAPQEMIQNCIAAQGEKAGLDKCYAVDAALKQWLTDNVLKGDGGGLIKPIIVSVQIDDLETGLPTKDQPLPPGLKKVHLPAEASVVKEEEIPGIIKQYGFFDSKCNPEGRFETHLVDNGDGLTVTEAVTGIMWQRQGCDITSLRQVQNYIAEINKKGFAGFSDWRMPTLEEAMSLVQPELNDNEQFIHPCFSRLQPFIFVAGQRLPGGYWFVDYKQATFFWASGTIPGAFGRLCRTA